MTDKTTESVPLTSARAHVGALGAMVLVPSRSPLRVFGGWGWAGVVGGLRWTAMGEREQGRDGRARQADQNTSYAGASKIWLWFHIIWNMVQLCVCINIRLKRLWHRTACSLHIDLLYSRGSQSWNSHLYPVTFQVPLNALEYQVPIVLWTACYNNECFCKVS